MNSLTELNQSFSHAGGESTHSSVMETLPFQNQLHPEEIASNLWVDPAGLLKRLAPFSRTAAYRSTMSYQGPQTKTLLKLITEQGAFRFDEFHSLFFPGGNESGIHNATKFDQAMSAVAANAVLGGFARRVSHRLGDEMMEEIVSSSAEFLDHLVELYEADYTNRNEDAKLRDFVLKEARARIGEHHSESILSHWNDYRTYFITIICEELRTRQFEFILADFH